MNKVAEYLIDKNQDLILAKSPREKVNELRTLMKIHDIDVWILPTADPHNCEYPPERWHGRSWISGFTGSAGTLVVLQDLALMWSDGRYHIQAEKQLKDTGISVIRYGEPDVPNIEEWLYNNLDDGSTIGFDGTSMPYSQSQAINELFNDKKVSFKIDIDLLDQVWTQRPQTPNAPVIEHDLKYAGKSRPEKLSEIRALMKKNRVDYFLISSLDDIAWLFNIRGSDAKHSSTTLAYSLISANEAWLCIDSAKVSNSILENLRNDNVNVVKYSEIFSLSLKINDNKSIYLDKSTTSTYLYNCIPSGCRISSGINLTSKLKSIKNKTEIKNFRTCLIRDGAHMVKFMKWLDDNIGKTELTELSIAKHLDSIRAEDELFHGQSFATISGFGPNGAQMHYLPKAESHSQVTADNLLLVDSGGLYQDGTTDITRTFSFGSLTEEQVNDFSLVVKSHINMARTVFLRGCRGTQIDYAARAEMWRQGINYNCATGHGVGFFLNVHEGPENIGQRFIDAEIKPGMIITNEPGIYRSGKHGVRIENIMLCYEKETTEFGTFYAFETISPCPIETRALNLEMFTKEEIDWLNSYHKLVYEQLSPLLDEEHKSYLKLKTTSIQA